MHEQILGWQKRIEELLALAPARSDNAQANEIENAERDKEWSTFTKPNDDGWKKKKVYD